MNTLQSGAFWVFPGSQKNLGYQGFSQGCSGLGSLEYLVAFIIILLAPILFQAVI